MKNSTKSIYLLITCLLACSVMTIFPIPIFALEQTTSLTIHATPETIKGRVATTITINLNTDVQNLKQNSLVITQIPSKLIATDSKINYQGSTDGVFSLESMTDQQEMTTITFRANPQLIASQTFNGTITFLITVPSFTNNETVAIQANFGEKTAYQQLAISSNGNTSSLPVDLYGWSAAGVTEPILESEFADYGALKYMLASPSGDNTDQFANGHGTMFRVLLNPKGITQTNMTATIRIPKGWQLKELSPTLGFPGTKAVSFKNINTSRIGAGYIRIAEMESSDVSGSSFVYRTDYDTTAVQYDGSILKIAVGDMAADKNMYVDFGLEYVGTDFIRDVITVETKSDQEQELRALGLTFPKVSATAIDAEAGVDKTVVFNDNDLLYTTTIVAKENIQREQLSVVLPLAEHVKLDQVEKILVNGEPDDTIHVVEQFGAIYLKNSVGALQANDEVRVSYALNVQAVPQKESIDLTPKIELSAGSVAVNSLHITKELLTAKDFSIDFGDVSVAAIKEQANVYVSTNDESSIVSIVDAQGRFVGNEATSALELSQLAPQTYTVTFETGQANSGIGTVSVQMDVTDIYVLPSMPGSRVPGQLNVRDLLMVNTQPAAINNSWLVPIHDTLALNEADLIAFYSLNTYFMLQAGILALIIIPILLLLFIVYRVKKMADCSDDMYRPRK